MVMLEDNPYGSALSLAALSALDSRGGQDRGLEDRGTGTGKSRGKKIIDIGKGPDVGSGHHGREDGGQPGHVRGSVDRKSRDGGKQTR